LSVGRQVLFEHNCDDLVGEVAFVGTTKFGQGRWVGIKLDTPTGKHDGSVRGDVYFSCPQLHGLFIRPQNVLRVFGEGESVMSAVTELPPQYARVVAALPPPESRQTLRARSASRHHTLVEKLQHLSPDVKEIPGDETRTLLDALRSAQAAHSECLDQQKAAEVKVGNLEQQVSEYTKQLSILQGQLQDHGIEDVARASEHATEIAVLKAAQAAAREMLTGTESDMEALRASLQAANNSEIKEVEEYQSMNAVEAAACTATREEIQTLVAAQQRHAADLQSLEQVASDLKEQSNSEVRIVHDEMRREAARAGAYEAASDSFTAESLALKDELHARMVSHSEQERALESQLHDAAAGRAVLLAEFEAARSDFKAAEMHAKAQQHSYALQIEAAALTAATRELEALRGLTRATSELHDECRECQLLMEELAGLRSLQDQQRQQMARQHARRPEQDSSWLHDSVMSSFCCGRSSNQPVAVDRGIKSVSLEPDARNTCSKKDPELTVEGTLSGESSTSPVEQMNRFASKVQ